MITWKKYIPLTFAVAFAFLSSISVYQFLNDRSGISHANPMMTVPVVIAKQAIGIGAKITENDLEVVSWPEEITPQESFRSARGIVGRTLKTNISENEPLVESKLLASGENFSSLIPPGMRAVTVAVKKSAALAEILDRGSLVDVLSLFRFDDTGMITAEAIVEKALVIGVHISEVESKSRNNSERPTMEVTLIVTPEEARHIVAMMNQSVIDLIVRNEIPDIAL